MPVDITTTPVTYLVGGDGNALVQEKPHVRSVEVRQGYLLNLSLTAEGVDVVHAVEHFLPHGVVPPVHLQRVECTHLHPPKTLANGSLSFATAYSLGRGAPLRHGWVHGLGKLA